MKRARDDTDIPYVIPKVIGYTHELIQFVEVRRLQ
jgi:hypothetical protein